MTKFKIIDQFFLQTYNELYSTDYKALSEIPEQLYKSDEIKLIADNYYHRLLPDKISRNNRLTLQVKRLKRFVYFLLLLLLGLVIGSAAAFFFHRILFK